ncbi:type II toxin-antitoxin system RelE family toxin [Niveispirillum sp. KHB5.9]|uniref:type II toxin-antitoxin system RelE family toxin n=1 Tax=Niveispirillum sp. KHB5.9 TaxID=3400269 RepID=UPI003A893511
MKLIILTNAQKMLANMPAHGGRAMRETLRVFAADPYGIHPWAKAFGDGVGRIRQGDWRALYRIDNGVMTVTITRIGNRREVYR